MRILFGLLTMLLGCRESKSVPDDFKLVLSSTASQPGNPGRTISVIGQPDKSYVLITTSDWADSRADTKKISREEVARLYSEILSAKVFSLKNSYANMNVLDGETTTLHITANGRTKTISMRNISPPELDSTLGVLGHLIEK